MSQIIIDSINGAPPYFVYICDVYEFNCYSAGTITTTVPPAVVFNVPTELNNAPQILIKII